MRSNHLTHPSTSSIVFTTNLFKKRNRSNVDEMCFAKTNRKKLKFSSSSIDSLFKKVYFLFDLVSFFSSLFLFVLKIKSKIRQFRGLRILFCLFVGTSFAKSIKLLFFDYFIIVIKFPFVLFFGK